VHLIDKLSPAPAKWKYRNYWMIAVRFLYRSIHTLESDIG